MTDHRFGDVHGNVFTSIVNGDCMTDHFRDDCGTSAPGFDYLFFAALVKRVNFFQQVVVYKRAFFSSYVALFTSAIPWYGDGE